MRRVRVSAFLASSTQQIHSFLARGVISSQSAYTFGVERIAFRKSAGSVWIVPCEMRCVIVLFYQNYVLSVVF